ncbi:MAG: hypothetical protein NW203_06625, partial [Hyphomonadaceae bacterium]|nr:hypothetical protein [Hyphomonadaceae bacterium]
MSPDAETIRRSAPRKPTSPVEDIILEGCCGLSGDEEGCVGLALEVDGDGCAAGDVGEHAIGAVLAARHAVATFAEDLIASALGFVSDLSDNDPLAQE